MKKADEFCLEKKIDHVAFIMDGNGRWAKKRLLPRSLGHKAGCKRIKEIAKEALKLEIKVMSIYVFSTENWSREQDEIDYLFKLLEEFFNKDVKELHLLGMKIVVSGHLIDKRIPVGTLSAIAEAKELTKENKKLIVNICFNFGGRKELVEATKLIASQYSEGKISLDDIDETMIKNSLWSGELPDVDLLIRTSGEERISNFMLFETAYSEFVFVKTLWPDFDVKEFHRALEIFQTRTRRFGGIKNE